MLKEIKVIDKHGVEIKPNNKNIVLVPLENKHFYVTTDEAENLLRIIKGQLLIIEAENVSNGSNGKHKENPHRKTGCDAGGTE